MDRKRAVLINTLNAEAICPDWRPMIYQDELEYANARLKQVRMPYQWQWVSVPSNLTGSVVMSAPADNAQAELRPGGNLL